MIVPRPVDLHEANDFVTAFHRHNKPVRGAKFCIGAAHDDVLVGVAIVGRPVARELQDGTTAEVTRCCVEEKAPKGCCSFLYAACWRAWRAMGGGQARNLHAEVGVRRLSARGGMARRG